MNFQAEFWVLLIVRRENRDRTFTPSEVLVLTSYTCQNSLKPFPVGAMALVGLLPARVGRWLSHGECALQKGPSLDKPVRNKGASFCRPPSSEPSAGSGSVVWDSAPLTPSQPRPTLHSPRQLPQFGHTSSLAFELCARVNSPKRDIGGH